MVTSLNSQYFGLWENTPRLGSEPGPTHQEVFSDVQIGSKSSPALVLQISCENYAEFGNAGGRAPSQRGGGKSE